VLDVPAEDDLARGPPQLAGDRADRLVVEDSTLGDRRPRLGANRSLLRVGLDLAVLAVRVQLDLVDRRTTVACSRSVVRCSTMKLLTPIARTWPSASSVSSAR